VEPALHHFHYKRHEVIVFHVLDHAEITFPFRDTASFVDMETGERLQVDPAYVRDEYRRQLDAFIMTWSPQAAGRVLIKLDDGQPLLAERAVGTGCVLLLGTGVHVDWTNLPLKPLFLPLLARLTLHLAGAETERTMRLAGAPVTLPLGRGKVHDQAGQPEVEVVRPCGEVVRVRKADQNADGWRYFDTHEAGVYLVRQVNRKPPKQMTFAVNIDPATVTQADLQARFGTRPLLFCGSPNDLAGTIERLREGTSLWEWFLAAVLIGLVLEVFLANRGAAALAAQARPETGPRPQSTAPTLSGPDGAAAGDDVREFLESLQ
jgi:hypothetical protein